MSSAHDARASRAALAVGKLDEAVPVQPQHIEDHISDRGALGQTLDCRLAAQMHARLQGLKARTAVLVERHDLPVEDRPVRAEGAIQRTQLGIGRRHVVLIATQQVDTPRLRVRDHADAVPLDLERPLGLVPRYSRNAFDAILGCALMLRSLPSSRLTYPASAGPSLPHATGTTARELRKRAARVGLLALNRPRVISEEASA